MKVSGHKDSVVWQKSMGLVTSVYSLLKKFPKEETYALGSQVRRAAISIPSNLAEGHAMKSTVHYLKHVYISRGSLAELETQITIAENLGYLTAEELSSTYEVMNEIAHMLPKLIVGLNKKVTNDRVAENNHCGVDFPP